MSCSGYSCVGCGACAPATTVTAPVPCAPMTFCSGNYTVTFNGQCLTKVKRTSFVEDGTYKNPTFVFQDGCITSVSEGTPSTTVLSGPCVGGTNIPGTGVTTASTQCNLSSVNSAGQLLTTASLLALAPLSVTGCGSASQPWVITWDGALAGGVNYSGCGTTIENGLITEFTPGITGISTTDPFLSVVRNGCDIEINLQGIVGKSVQYTRPLCCMSAAGVPRFLGMGVVTAVGTTAKVSFCWSYAEIPGYTPPPAIFTSVQAAVSWLDLMTFTCPTTFTNPTGDTNGGP